jgi:hypothetical protein
MFNGKKLGAAAGLVSRAERALPFAREIFSKCKA